MAIPRVFVSSTCYDLSEVRDSLESFIKSFNYVPVLSDKGDVYYNPDLHTHDACLKEVESCQLFVLIIGGRFGGEYHKDKKDVNSTPKSITNREYQIAKTCGMPVFTFVKRNVMDNHLFYKDNMKHNPEVKSIYYSAIEKQEYAQMIFDFIDEVRHSSENNSFFSFDYAKEIQEKLSKQWAGMLYDFLQERQRQKEVSTTNKLIENLTIATEKTEELMKKLLTNEMGTNAELVIDDINREADAKRFFKEVFNYYKVSNTTVKSIVREFLKIDGDMDEEVLWHEYLVKSKYFKYNYEIYSSEDSDYTHELALDAVKGNKVIIIKSEEEMDFFEPIIHEMESLFQSFKDLNKEQREKVLRTLL